MSRKVQIAEELSGVEKVAEAQYLRGYFAEKRQGGNRDEAK